MQDKPDLENSLLWRLLLETIGDSVVETVGQVSGRKFKYALLLFDVADDDCVDCVSNAATEEEMLKAFDAVRKMAKGRIILRDFGAVEEETIQ